MGGSVLAGLLARQALAYSLSSGRQLFRYLIASDRAKPASVVTERMRHRGRAAATAIDPDAWKRRSPLLRIQEWRRGVLNTGFSVRARGTQAAPFHPNPQPETGE